MALPLRHAKLQFSRTDNPNKNIQLVKNAPQGDKTKGSFIQIVLVKQRSS